MTQATKRPGPLSTGNRASAPTRETESAFDSTTDALLDRHDELQDQYFFADPGKGPTFGEVAAFYDFATPIPLPINSKGKPPVGTTGWTGVPLVQALGKAEAERINRKKWGAYELGLRLDDNLVGLDVDAYEANGKLKGGVQTLENIAMALGGPDHALPPTYVSTGRDWASGSGIRFFRTKRAITRDCKPHDQVDIEMVHRGHRYAVAWPSVVVDEKAERVYRWYDLNGVEMDQPPTLEEIPYLPQEWEDYLFDPAHKLGGSGKARVSNFDPDVDEATEEHQEAAERILQGILDNSEDGIDQAGGRNNWASSNLFLAYGFKLAGCLQDWTEDDIAKAFEACVPGEEGFWATVASAQAGAVPILPDITPETPEEVRQRYDAEVDDMRASFPKLVDLMPKIEQEAERVEEVARETAKSSWSDVDLTEVWDGLEDGTLDVPKPTVGHLKGNAGRSLFYEGATNMIFGDSNSGKTWTALLATVEALQEGGEVIYVDYEGNKVSMVNRLRVLGLQKRHLKRLHMKRPEDAFTPYARELLERELEDLEPGLVVIDSLGEALALDGKNPNADEEVALWFRGFANMAADAGACVLIIDHLPKNSDGRFSIGSQRKRSALKGAQYRQEMVEPFSRDEVGYAKLVVTKDREGTAAPGTTVAELMAYTADGGTFELWEPKPEHVTPAKDQHGDRIVEFLTANPRSSKKQLKAGVQGNDHDILEALDKLLADGTVVAQKTGDWKTAPQLLSLA